MKAVLVALLASASAAASAQGAWQRTDTGVLVTPVQGPEAAVRLDGYGERIIRVRSAPTRELNLPPSLMVTAKPLANAFSVAEAPGSVTLKTAGASADVDLVTGNVTFRDGSGQAVL